MADGGMHQVDIHEKKFKNTVRKYHHELQYKNSTVFQLPKKRYAMFLC
jgi:hypothetical protein